MRTAVAPRGPCWTGRRMSLLGYREPQRHWEAVRLRCLVFPSWASWKFPSGPSEAQCENTQASPWSVSLPRSSSEPQGHFLHQNTPIHSSEPARATACLTPSPAVLGSSCYPEPGLRGCPIPTTPALSASSGTCRLLPREAWAAVTSFRCEERTLRPGSVGLSLVPPQGTHALEPQKAEQGRLGRNPGTAAAIQEVSWHHPRPQGQDEWPGNAPPWPPMATS